MYIYMYMYIPVLSQLVHEYIVELHWKPCNGNVYIYLAVTGCASLSSFNI